MELVSTPAKTIFPDSMLNMVLGCPSRPSLTFRRKALSDTTRAVWSPIRWSDIWVLRVEVNNPRRKITSSRVKCLRCSYVDSSIGDDCDRLQAIQPDSVGSTGILVALILSALSAVLVVVSCCLVCLEQSERKPESACEGKIASLGEYSEFMEIPESENILDVRSSSTTCNGMLYYII